MDLEYGYNSVVMLLKLRQDRLKTIYSSKILNTCNFFTFYSSAQNHYVYFISVSQARLKILYFPKYDMDFPNKILNRNNGTNFII